MGLFGGNGGGKLKGFISKVGGKIANFKEKHPVIAGAVGALASKLPGGNVGKLFKGLGKLKDKFGGGKLAELGQKLKNGGVIDKDEINKQAQDLLGDDYTGDEADALEEELINENKAGMFGGGGKGSIKKWWGKQSKTMKIVYIVGGSLVVVIVLGFTIFKGAKKGKKFFGKFRK